MAGEPRLATAPPRTLHDLLVARSPGFDAVRLVLAVLVLVSHTWPLGGFGPEPASPLTPRYLTLGGFAVGGFFALSGLLVGRSAMERPPAAYARARLVRVLPGYWTAIVVSAFGVALLGWLHERGTISGFVSFDPAGPFGYVGRAALFPVEFAHGVADVFTTSTPYGLATGGSFVNGSLWTLPYELRCYLVVGLLAVVARRYGTRRSVTVAWLLLAVAALLWEKRPAIAEYVLGPYADAQMVAFAFVFVTGTLAAVWADRISLFGVLPLAALALALAGGHRSHFLAEHVGGAALVLLLPPFAVVLAPLGRRLRGVDLSYGMYLFAWPVQQLLAMYGLDRGPWTFVAVATAITAALATISWFAVERPAMHRWRRP